jgi:hypothetical protein
MLRDKLPLVNDSMSLVKKYTINSNNIVGRGFTLAVNSRKYKHFANYLVAFQGLAAARGDILGGI